MTLRLKNTNRFTQNGFTCTPTLALLQSVFVKYRNKLLNINIFLLSPKPERSNKNTMPKLVSGFTLVEALVSIAIVTMIMSSVLFNYSTFSDNLTLSSAGQELAIVIRQAQTYGLTVREVTREITAGGQFDSAYGVYFDKNDPTSYYLFADLNGNQKYDVGNGCGSGENNTECVEKLTLRNNVRVSDVCDGSNCPPHPSVKTINVTFLRPNPDANIIFTNNGGINVGGQSLTGKVVLMSAKGKTLTITIESTGQVLVGSII
jgi:type II secretory pathway pseudopilin PulG